MSNEEQRFLSAEYNNFGEDIQNKRIQSEFTVRSKAHSLMYQSVVNSIGAPNSIIDLGCGDGGLTFLLAKKSQNVTGVDISLFNVNLAKTRYKDQPNLNFELGDVCRTNFLDNSFDLSVSHHVLEHLSDFNEGLDELKRITRNTIFICLPTANSPLSWTLLGGGNYWKHGKIGIVRLSKGLVRTLFNFIIGKIGVDEGSYSSLQGVPHIFFFSRRVSKKLSCTNWRVVNYQPQVTGFPWISKSIKLGRRRSFGGLGTIFILERIT
jgi:ubiquinone/menaquinone biosynthesis C-methylase UbiE